MRANDLRVGEFLDFATGTGSITFRGRRMLLYDADAMGTLRRELIETLGRNATRGLFTRLSYANGYRDAETLRGLFPWESREEWYKAGPVLQGFEGKAAVVRTEFRRSASGDLSEIEIEWDDSHEAAQHLRQFGETGEPVCWALVGHAGGFFSACLGDEIYFIERACRAAGAAHCVAVGKRRSVWGPEQRATFDLYEAATLRNELARLEKALELHRKAASRLERSSSRWRDLAERLKGAGAPVVRSRQMREVLDLAMQVASGTSTVLLHGESGTGKELIARWIHARGPRSRGPFVAVNCGALPEPLLESELFGHVRGAFTGAVSDKQGLFEEANHGTLLLDEIADTPSAIQVKLLRALQDREIRRVGATRSMKVDVRVIAATNREVERLVASGRFRRDLYFRLNVIGITIPPLRDRREEIVPLARLFLRRFSDQMRKSVLSISSEALGRLTAYPWPGNVRELENVVERAVLLTTRDCITVAELPPSVRAGTPAPGLGTAQAPRSLKELEKQAILFALERHRGNRSRAARELGVSFRTLLRRLKTYHSDLES